MNSKLVIAAMSGGVDSSAAAALLLEKGYEVIGITMKTWGFMESGGAPKYESGCCSLDAVFDARSVCEKLKIPHYTLDFTKAFEDEVINNFTNEYLKGRTPNPCVLCNRKIKWEELLKKADDLGAKYVATGHYANVEYSESDKRYKLKNSENNPKDQSYALWGLTQESLSRTLLPLGNMLKSEIREIAERMGLRTASKPDSQEICFVPDNNYERFLKETKPGEISQIPEGELVYEGKTIARHKGIPFFTIGQRKGLGIALGKPAYVTKIEKDTNKVYIGSKEDLLQNEVIASEVNYISTDMLLPGERVFGKIRYSDKPAAAEILSADQTKLKVRFEEPKSAVTPGQSIVLYDKQGYVLAGGIID